MVVALIQVCCGEDSVCCGQTVTYSKVSTGSILDISVFVH